MTNPIQGLPQPNVILDRAAQHSSSRPEGSDFLDTFTMRSTK